MSEFVKIPPGKRRLVKRSLRSLAEPSPATLLAKSFERGEPLLLNGTASVELVPWRKWSMVKKYTITEGMNTFTSTMLQYCRSYIQ